MRAILQWWPCVLLLAAACDASEATQDEPCAVDEDCGGKQSCLRTASERELGLPGICSTQSGDCIHGRQLGCACTPEQYEMDCIAPALPLYEGYPEMECDPQALLCVVPSESEETEGGTT
jgi:hypothetical protein